MFSCQFESLPAEVASQIAAGEVIERPASVVKELIENSLDARASFISIEIKDAGRSLIEVADDGTGIPAEELPLAVERHATSKLSSAADLFQIETLGFRGEALASIGSVARMTVTSRSVKAEIGARLLVEGGRVYPVQPAGVPVGTVVKVENLFLQCPGTTEILEDRSDRAAADREPGHPLRPGKPRRAFPPGAGGAQVAPNERERRAEGDPGGAVWSGDCQPDAGGALQR